MEKYGKTMKNDENNLLIYWTLSTVDSVLYRNILEWQFSHDYGYNLLWNNKVLWNNKMISRFTSSFIYNI